MKEKCKWLNNSKFCELIPTNRPATVPKHKRQSAVSYYDLSCSEGAKTIARLNSFVCVFFGTIKWNRFSIKDGSRNGFRFLIAKKLALTVDWPNCKTRLALPLFDIGDVLLFFPATKRRVLWK